MPTDEPVVLSLLVLHIAAGSAALLAAIGAVATQWWRAPHRWHVVCGQVFFWGMIGVFVTALPLSVLGSSLFLFLIAIFSGYLAWSGYRYAKRRKGPVPMHDLATAVVMVVAAIAMIVVGGWMIVTGDLNGVTLVVFGGLALVLGGGDLQAYRSGDITGKERIASHLGMMLGATIAAVTAFLVTNFQSDPEFLLWIAPTVVILPIIFYWRRRVLQ